MKLFTIGHSNRETENFIELLKVNHIKLVLDVRRYPRSPKFPQYDGRNLQEALKEAEIIYQWMGDSLGGFRVEGYENYMKSELYKSGIEQLEEMGRKLNTAIMCAEKHVTRCHRLHISNSLSELGWSVVHIIDKHTRFDHDTLLQSLRDYRTDASQMQLPF